jgi:hypothetical protein
MYGIKSSGWVKNFFFVKVKHQAIITTHCVTTQKSAVLATPQWKLEIMHQESSLLESYAA